MEIMFLKTKYSDESITGYEAADVLGRHCHDNVLVHLNTQGVPQCMNGCALKAAIANGRAQSFELYVLHKLGHRVPVLLRAAPLIDTAGNTIGGIQTFVESQAGMASLERVRELERLSFVDPLTELANRRYSEISLRTRLEELQRYGWPFGVILLDIDDLKAINDAFGHAGGDRVLKAVARTLQLGSRPFDVKGRWGGDEFIAILANLDAAGLENAAIRLRALIEETRVTLDETVLQITASSGAVVARADETVEQLVARADRLLYDSKAAGKNRSSIERVT